MPTFKVAPPEVAEMAAQIIAKYDTHDTLVANNVKVDFLFAYGDRDDDGELCGDALKQHGVKALGLTRKRPLKERAEGHGDAQVLLDADWWDGADDEERAALLDHELTHIRASTQRDDLGRPIIKLRPHDWQFGWFNVIAERHGRHSQEVKQAASIKEVAGQYYWPSMLAMDEQPATRMQRLETEKDESTVTLTTANKSVTVPLAKWHDTVNALTGKE